VSRLGRLVRRTWFPLVLLTVVAVGFVAFGPPSARSRAEALRAMAPPGTAGDGTYSAPADASPTEREIAKRYEIVRVAPDTVDAYVLLGDAYLQHVRETADPTDYGRAASALNEANVLDPDNPEAVIGLGVLALARHDFAGALSLGQRAVALAPSSSRARGVVVDALTELGRYPDAVTAAQEMIDLRPDLASLSRVAYQRELRGDIDGAIEAMARAFDAGAGTPPENREYIRVLIGDLCLLKGDEPTARQVYQASLTVIPDYVWANAGLARAAVARGELETAIDYYEKATDKLPIPELLIALGETQEATGHAAEAEGNYELVRAVQKLLVANGVNVDLELALFDANHGDPDSAVDLALRAYATQPNVKAADALGWALFRAGRVDEAAAYSAESLKLGSTYPGFAFHAGAIALVQGRTADAETYLERATSATGTLSALDLATARASTPR
jgi:tetratricopeptide (TPR) repeat protein